MMAEKEQTKRLPVAEGIELAVEEFRPLVEKILQAGKRGTHELILSVDEAGRPKIRVRGPYVHPSEYWPC